MSEELKNSPVENGDKSHDELVNTYDQSLNTVKDKEVIEGTVIALNKREVVVNIGYKSDGIIPMSEFRYNPDTFIWGQDVANKEKGGVFNVTKGMQQEFGDARVFSAPIAEDYIVGTANGMSRFDPKIHVVIEGAEFADYFWPAVE